MPTSTRIADLNYMRPLALRVGWHAATILEVHLDLFEWFTLGPRITLCDVKHIYSWVKENNLRAYVIERFDKQQVFAGDPDCRLGVKRSTNQEQTDGTTKEKKELLWGYGSGVAAATTPNYGDVVLAEYIQPFNEGDVTYFRPLYERTVMALEAFPLHLTVDGAFDAWYIYEPAARHGGIAAVPLNQHSSREGGHDADDVPRCRRGWRMVPRFFFEHTDGYRAQRFGCPLVLSTPSKQPCEWLSLNHGHGCHKNPNWEVGGLQRVLLDRSSPLYKAVYTQRTSCERINSQAKELGIERPKVRNRLSVANLNILIYVIINVRALDRAKWKHTKANLALKGLVDCIIEKLFRQMVPLTPCAETKDDSL